MKRQPSLLWYVAIIGIVVLVLGYVFYRPWDMSAVIIPASLLSIGAVLTWRIINGRKPKDWKSSRPVIWTIENAIAPYLAFFAGILGILMISNGICDFSEPQVFNLRVIEIQRANIGWQPAGRASSVGRSHGGNQPVMGFVAVVENPFSATDPKRFHVVPTSPFAKMSLKVVMKPGFYGIPWVHKMTWSSIGG